MGLEINDRMHRAKNRVERNWDSRYGTENGMFGMG